MTDFVALIQKVSVSEKSNKNRDFQFLFGLRKSARKNQKDATPLSLLA